MPTFKHFDVGGGSRPHVTGNYATLTLGPFTDTVVGIQTDTIFAGLIMPWAFRIEKVSWEGGAAAAAVATMQLERNVTAFSTTGMVDILSADVVLATNNGSFARPTGTTPTIVAAQRNLARGDRLFVTLTTDGAGTFTRQQVYVSGFITGFVQANEGDD